MDRLEEQVEVTWRADWSKAERGEVRREEASGDVERGSSTAVTLMQRERRTLQDVDMRHAGE